MFYVCIDHLSDDKLGFLGYTMITEDERFKLYRDYTGDEHIVDKQGKKYLMVEDVNDAMQMSPDIIVMPSQKSS